jgi:hypothetical protein
MSRQYFFLPLFFVLILVLGWFSSWGQIESSQFNQLTTSLTGTPQSGVSQELRQELIENLDRLVSYQHYYHSLNGRFTLVLNRIGLPLSLRVSSEYDVRVLVASSDELLIHAVSEKNGKVLDRVSIDQDYKIHANFLIPAPRRSYLRATALKHLRLLREAPRGVVVPERGVYQGYFEYSVKTSSDDHVHAFAHGIKAPVVGDRIELNSSNDQELAMELESILTDEWSGNAGEWFAEWSGEQEFLAQNIFLGETGRYAKDRSELARTTRFQLYSSQLPNDSLCQLPTDSPDDLLKIDSSKESSRQQGVSARDFWGARRSLSSIPVSTSLRVIPLGKIEIEPMDPNDSAE